MTTGASRHFKYSLDPLLAKHGWEVDALRIELSTARQVLELRQQELDALEQESGSVRKAASQLAVEGQILDLARRQILASYLSFLDEQVQAKQSEANQAQKLCEEILVQLNRALQAQKGIETHKEKLRLEHRDAVSKQGFAEADEAWLLRPGKREDAA